MGDGREGDWECCGCNNRNYAFRSFCNRCKQPPLLVDIKTPAGSKWLPRLGDWICSAIDLVDEAATKLKMEITSKSTELDEIDRVVLKLEMEKLSLKNDIDKSSKERLSKLDNDLDELKQKFVDQLCT